MTNYRNSKLVERYEDVVFELDVALNSNPGNDASQKKVGYRFVVNNSGESTPFDWYHARFNIDFKLQKLAHGANVVANDHNGIVNSSFALIRRLNVKMNGFDVYDCSEANHVTNIKNLLEYSNGYSKSQGTNEFFYIDTKRHAEERTAAAQAATSNSGFAARKLLLNGGATVNAEIFNADGKSLYMSKYLDTRKRTYLRELVEKGNSTQQQSASFRTSTAINKPIHVFVFIINDASIADATAQTSNKFLYNTFTVTNQTLASCHLEVGNGKDYPEVHYRPTEESTRVFRDVLNYVHANSDYAGDTLLNRANYSDIFSFIYFDLTKQPTDIKDGMTKLTFKYTLSGPANADYSVYALVLYEQDVEMRKTDGRLVLRSM